MRPYDRRPSGIPAAPELPWGSHFCQLYDDAADLLEVLVPYLAAGLEANELCSLTVAGPLTVERATGALESAVPRFSERVRSGQLEVLPAPGPSPGEADASITAKLDRAVLAGFDGLRLAWPALPCEGGPRFECPGLEAIGTLSVVALFYYPRVELDAVRLMEVVKAHRFALLRDGESWQVLEAAEAQIVKEELRRTEQRLQSLFANMAEGFAYHRIVLDPSGRPCDYVFLEANETFGRMTGLEPEAILGKRVTEVLPGIETDAADWIGRYGEVALSGRPIQFESQARPLGRWYAVSAFSPQRGFFAVTAIDITDRKRAEAERRAVEARLAVTLRSIGDAVLSTDPEGRVTFLNPVAAALTGFGEYEALGLTSGEVFRTVHEVTRAPVEDIVGRVLREKRVVKLANHASLLSRDGREVPIEDSAAPILADDGTLEGVVVVFQDVTAKRRTLAALERARDELEARVAERTEQLVRANEKLEARAARLRELAGELTLAERRERRRIAMLLHDDVQQLLAAAKLRARSLGRASEPEARASGAAIQALLGDAIQASRSLAAEISPPVLHEQGLVPALRWLVGWMA